MNKKLLILTSLSIMSVALTGCINLNKLEKASDVNKEAKQSLETEEGVEKKEEASNSRIVKSGDIAVFGIKAGDIVASPVKIKGEAAIGSGPLTVEIRNSEHQALIKESVNVYTDELGEKGIFSININFIFKGTKEGFIAVYESAEGGEIKNLVEIPVKFATADDVD